MLFALAGVVSIAGVRRNYRVLAPAGVLIALSLSLAGHPATGAWPIVGVVADLLHLLAAALWIGTIVAGIRLGASTVVRRISPVAILAVVTIVLTGIVQSVRNVGAWRPFLESAYGITIDRKVALLLVALALAWGARRAIARGELDLRRRLIPEAIVVAMVVGFTAVLVDLPLPREVPAPVAVASAAMRVADLDVRVSATPVDAQHWTLRLVASRAGRPAALSGADASVSEASRHAGPFAVPFARDPSGAFTGSVTLPFAGRWSAFVSARSGEFDENHLTLPLTENPTPP
jgi:copper transport protein